MPLYEGHVPSAEFCANCSHSILPEAGCACVSSEPSPYRAEYVATIPPADQAARVSVTTETRSVVGGIPISISVFGDVVGLPEPRRGTIYIVSLMVANACPNRVDLAIVNETMRDASGQIVGARSLSFPNGNPDERREAQRARVNALLDRTA